jgi:hypothetical protein
MSGLRGGARVCEQEDGREGARRGGEGSLQVARERERKVRKRRAYCQRGRGGLVMVVALLIYWYVCR